MKERNINKQGKEMKNISKRLIQAKLSITKYKERARA
jgi:hypothetical protein